MILRLRFLLAALLGAALLVGTVAGCGDDSDSGDLQSPTPSGTPDLSPRSGGVAAARQYLEETGIEGDKGDLTDPVACAEITGDTDGDFCIHEDFSTYAPGLVILRVADTDNPDEDVWEMRLTPDSSGWHVDSVEPFGENE